MPELKQAPTPEQIQAQEKRNRRIVFGCLSAFGCSFVFMIIVGIAFVAQGGEENPLLRLFGIDAPTFIRILTAFVHLIFGFLSLGAFIAAIMGVFRLISAKKEDREAKRKGLRFALAGGIGFMVSAFLWITIFLFLNARAGQNTQVRTFDIRPVAGEEELLSFDQLSAPVTLQFDATRLQINVRRYANPTYVWDFNDGVTATGQVQTHTFKNKGSNQGRFTIGLTITARDRQTGKEVPIVFARDIVITNLLPDPVFAITPEKGEAPLTVQADAGLSTDLDGEIIRYEWDFDGNGEFVNGTGAKAEYIYEVAGTYQAALRITDSSNQTAEAKKEIVVEKTNRPDAVIKIIGNPEKMFAGETYTFDASASSSPKGRITNYRWNFGDDTPQEITRTAKHSFASKGTYVISLSVTDETNQITEKEMTINVEEVSNAPRPVVQVKPEAKEIDGVLTVEGRVPLTVEFTAAQSTDPDNDIVDFQWDMDGDGISDERGSTVTHTYRAIGETIVTVTVLDSRDNKTEKEIVVKALGQGIKAQLSADPIEGIVPLTVRFDASGSSYPEGSIVNYRWNFGDESPEVTGTAIKEYRYTQIGTFTAHVTAVASDGTEAEDSIIVNVRPIELTACFTPSITQGPAPLTVAFDPACAQGTIARYKWTFGDNEQSTTRKPVHIFEEPGTYEVSLEVSDNQNVINTFTSTITVQER